MKTARLTLAAVVLLALAAGGCSQLSPAQQAIVFSDGVTASAAAIRAGHADKRITDAELVASEPYVEAANAAADKLADAADKGPITFGIATQAAEAALVEVLKYRQMAGRVRPVAKPTSQPGVRDLPPRPGG